MEDKPVSLRRLLHNTHTERALICTFLAMLELVRLQAVPASSAHPAVRTSLDQRRLRVSTPYSPTSKAPATIGVRVLK